jgi:ATP/maltotriose-dependent transcriptional regulator MalT
LLEGANAFEKATSMLDNGDPLTEICLAKMLYNLGWMCNNGGTFEKAQAAFERSWLLYSQHDALPTLGRGRDPRIMLGFIYFRLGKVSAAETLGQDAFRDHMLREDSLNLTSVCYLLANVARLQGQYEEAGNYARQGSAAATTRENGQPISLGTMLFSLGHIALDQGDNAEAIRCFEQIQAIAYNRGYIYGVAASLVGLGRCAFAMGHYEEAHRYLREALHIITRDRMLSLMPFIYIGIGELFLQTGKQARGIELLTFALHHPASDYHTKERAQHLLTSYQAAVEAVQQTSTKADFDAVTTVLLDELQIPEDSTLARHTPYADEILAEPLSERELMVLMLLADGLSNREIAEQLFLSVATVKWYLTHIYSKLGVQNRTLAIMRAHQLNLLR